MFTLNNVTITFLREKVIVFIFMPTKVGYFIDDYFDPKNEYFDQIIL